MQDSDQELQVLIQELPISVDASDPFEYPTPGLVVTQGKINDMLDLLYLIQDVYQMLYLTKPQNASKSKLRTTRIYKHHGKQDTQWNWQNHRTSYNWSSLLQGKDEICRSTLPVGRYNGKNWKTKHKSKIDYENNDVSFHNEKHWIFCLSKSSNTTNIG